MKIPHILLTFAVFASSYSVVQAKGFSSSSRSVSVSSSRSYSSSPSKSYSPVRSTRATKTRYVSPPKTSSTTRKSNIAEYDYYALADCSRVFRPVNGYRCLDRD
jgi:hypothetical protein